VLRLGEALLCSLPEQPRRLRLVLALALRVEDAETALRLGVALVGCLPVQPRRPCALSCGPPSPFL
jgi:hypothetical protein